MSEISLETMRQAMREVVQETVQETVPAIVTAIMTPALAALEDRFDRLEGRVEVLDRKFDLSLAQFNDQGHRLLRLEAR